MVFVVHSVYNLSSHPFGGNWYLHSTSTVHDPNGVRSQVARSEICEKRFVVKPGVARERATLAPARKGVQHVINLVREKKKKGKKKMS